MHRNKKHEHWHKLTRSYKHTYIYTRDHKTQTLDINPKHKHKQKQKHVQKHQHKHNHKHTHNYEHTHVYTHEHNT